MSESAPSVVVLAGPNGAGKSTSAPSILREAIGISEFVNADVIARGLSAFEPERAAVAAGRIMLARLRELARRRSHFAFETTLASRSFAPWIAELMATGYLFHLVFLRLPDAEMAVARVAARVQEGGHHVPEETIRRRYEAGLRHFSQLYRPMATAWSFWDNSTEVGLIPIATGGEDAEESRETRAILLDGTTIQRAHRKAMIENLDRHKRLGNPIVVWRDGKVVRIPAEEIEIPGAATEARS